MGAELALHFSAFLLGFPAGPRFWAASASSFRNSNSSWTNEKAESATATTTAMANDKWRTTKMFAVLRGVVSWASGAKAPPLLVLGLFLIGFPRFSLVLCWCSLRRLYFPLVLFFLGLHQMRMEMDGIFPLAKLEGGGRGVFCTVFAGLLRQLF